ncbi:MAG: hypothetical protein ACREJC_00480 [Tepidisphaeraceae bacterium]
MKQWHSSLWLCILMISAASAQTTAPSTRPVVPIDPSTPRGALKALLSAMQVGDVEAIRARIMISSPAEDQMVSAMARMAQADHNLRKTAEQVFGKEESKKLGDPEANFTEAMMRLDAADETIDGSSASVSGAGEDAKPVTLRLVDGSWRIPASEFSRGADEYTITQRVRTVDAGIAVYVELIDELQAGKFKTADEAGEAFRGRVMIAMMRQSVTEPTTQATQPTTQP